MLKKKVPWLSSLTLERWSGFLKQKIPFRSRLESRECQMLKSWATSYIMTKIRRVMQVGTEQSERSKCFPTSSYASYCILAEVHWLERVHDSTALKFLQGSCMVPAMLHKLIPHWGEIDCILLQRGFLTELDHWSQEAQKHLRAWILTNSFLPSRHTSPFFLPMLYLQCNITTDADRISSFF